MKHRDQNRTGLDLVEGLGLPPACGQSEQFMRRAAFYLDELRATSKASDTFLAVMVADIAWDAYSAILKAMQAIEPRPDAGELNRKLRAASGMPPLN
jgi:hypothetical protein